MKVRAVAIAAAAAIAVGVGWGMAPPAAAVAGGPPGITPASFTPTIADSGTDGTTEQIRHLAQCGNTMYAVGQFTKIKQGGTTVTRTNAFSFSATTGKLTTWNPAPNARVDTVALSANCATAYLGGTFTSVTGGAAKNLAAVNTTTGSLVTTFGHSAGGRVATLAVAGTHLIAGGYFTGINGSAKPYLVSLNPTTGKDDNYLPNMQVTGVLPGVKNPTRIYNQQLSHSGTRDLIEGAFLSVAGHTQRQAFILDLGATASVDAWRANDFDRDCFTGEPFYAQDGAWSPNDATVYFGTTGYKPASGLGFNTSDPRSGPCDAAIAFSSAPAAQTAQWMNYPGCDSLFTVEADATTVYFGGHERWASNPLGCDAAGPGAIVAPGMMGLNPLTGALTYNPTRGRGLGADDMLITSQGLWIASDNFQNTNSCGKTSTGAPATGHAGLCLLPY